MQTIVIRRMSFFSLFKLLLIGFGAVFSPATLLVALLAFFGIATWTYNGVQLQGAALLLNAVVCAVLVPVAFAALSSGVVYAGLMIYGRFRRFSIKVQTD